MPYPTAPALPDRHHAVLAASAFSYFHATRAYLERHGKPVTFYSDKAGVFRVNAKTPKAGDGFTQFGRATSDLNIDVICANTPAAKGRVERAHQTLQDRLVKELRLRGISRMDDANAYLPEFMQDYNRRFARAARNDHDAHRPLTERDCLDDIFTWQEGRRVTAQLTVHHKRTMYLLEPTEEAKAAAKKRVTVVEYEDGRVSIRFGGVALDARSFSQGRLRDPGIDRRKQAPERRPHRDSQAPTEQGTHALPDISILESRPTPESGFDMGC